MSQVIVQINLKFSVSRTELEGAWLPAAPVLAEVPGLVWKVWLMDESQSAAGGIYLFEDRAAAETFLGSEIVQSMGSDPSLSSIDVKIFDILTAHSAYTRAPLGEKTRI